MNDHFYFNSQQSSELTDRLFAMIRDARKYIKTGNFFFKDENLKQALLDAASRGIAVFVLTNLTGSEYRQSELSSIKTEGDPHLPNLHQLHRAGVHVRCSQDLHAKFIIADGKHGMVMSANYTANSLYGNPENGIEVAGTELADLETVFDAMYRHPDIELGEDCDRYRYARRNSLVPAGVIDVIGSESRLRLTAAPRNQGVTNLKSCRNRSILGGILEVIRNAQRQLLIVSWSYNAMNRLPQLRDAISDARNRGVDVRMIYSDKGPDKSVQRTIRELQNLLGADFQRIATALPYNHSKCVISESSGVMFTANIDGAAGLLGGFELGCVLTEDQRRQALAKLNQALTTTTKH